MSRQEFGSTRASIFLCRFSLFIISRFMLKLPKKRCADEDEMPPRAKEHDHRVTHISQDEFLVILAFFFDKEV